MVYLWWALDEGRQG